MLSLILVLTLASDALLVTATLNSVGVLVRTRASIASKILNAILNFNPFKIVNGPLTPRIKVMIKAMERTTKAFLINLNKRYVVSGHQIIAPDFSPVIQITR